jgi:hypothetical protein
VERIEPGAGDGGAARVVLSDGRSVEAGRGVVVATEGPEAVRLLAGRLQVRQGRGLARDVMGTTAAGRTGTLEAPPQAPPHPAIR